LARYLAVADIERVIASCDLTKTHGIRDNAILLLLARLGLRGGDILNMRARAGHRQPKSKCERILTLPLLHFSNQAAGQFRAKEHIETRTG
jgi:integrase/recombinase XerD